MTKKQLLLTFDYELFLGQASGSVEKCLIEPTNKLLQVLNKYSLKGLFFVDATYLVRLREIAQTNIIAQQDLDAIQVQIQYLLRTGHEIGLHIHPHWADAVYRQDSNDWALTDLSKYAFSALSLREQENVFDTALQALLEICQSEQADYSIKTFRAGGLLITPFEQFAPLLRRYDIIHEFSLLPSFKMQSSYGQFDFTEGLSQAYRFEASDFFKASSNGEFYQYPISVARLNFCSKVWGAIHYRLYKNAQSMQRIGDGIGTGPSIHYVKRDKSLHWVDALSVEMMTRPKLGAYLSYLKQHDTAHFLSHPKLLSPYTLDLLDLFLSKASRRYTLSSGYRIELY